MSRSKKRNALSRSKNQQSNEHVVRRERVSLATWEKFERWKRHEENLLELIDEAASSWEDHWATIAQWSHYLDCDDLNSVMWRLKRTAGLIEKSPDDIARRKFYEKMLPAGKSLVAEVVITEIGNGKL